MSKRNDRVEQENVDLNAAFAGDTDEQEIDEALILNQLMGAAEEVRNAKRVKIMMHNQEGSQGDQPVFVAVNGMGYSIPREIPVIIPEPILKALEDAVEVKYFREEKDGMAFGPIQERHVRRFPFSVIS